MTLLTLLTLSIFLTVASRFASIKMSVIVLKQARFLTLSKKVPKVSKVSIQIFTLYLHMSFVFVTGEAKYKKL